MQARQVPLRHELGRRMIIRYAPQLVFVLDQNIEYGVHIATVLKQVNPEGEQHADE